MSFTIATDQVYRVIAYFDPTIVANDASGTISKYDTTIEEYLEGVPFDPLELVPGTLYYDWTPTETGKYLIEFQTNEGPKDVTVYFVGALNPTDQLGADATFYFLGELHPLYIDPNEVLIYYPEGDIVEITEYVYRASKELEYLTGQTDITDITPVMHDYVLASVLCQLSRIYIFDGGMAGFSSASSFTLGDLSVKNEVGSGNGSSGSGGAPSSWCDLAAMLRERLAGMGMGIRSVVKAGNQPNPIPDRSLRRFER